MGNVTRQVGVLVGLARRPPGVLVGIPYGAVLMAAVIVGKRQTTSLKQGLTIYIRIKGQVLPSGPALHRGR